MKDLHEFLGEREIYIVENHPAMTYSKLAVELGVTANRVAQIKIAAMRKIREEKSREAARERGRLKVDYSLTRSECYLVIRALRNYALYLTPSNVRTRTNPKYEPDPDIARCEALVSALQELLAEKNNQNPKE